MEIDHVAKIDHVEITSTTHTDSWSGYNGLMVRGFVAHLTVNHSHHFVDSLAMEIEFINETYQIMVK